MACLGGLLLLQVSCSKESSQVPVQVDETRMVDITGQKAMTDALYDDVTMEILQATSDNGLAQAITLQQACATVSVTPQDPAIWPKTVTIDYGTTGCTGLNGFLRKGKIIYTLSKRFLESGAVASATFDNYFVNGYKLEGTYSITNNGFANGVNVTIKLVNGKVTNPDGKWYTKTTLTNWVQSAGQGSLSFQDDEYNLTGNGTISDKDGTVLTVNSRTALLRRVNCVNTVSGLADLTFNKVSGLLDFGAGTCDKNAVITVAGKNYDITLP